jgi:3-phosphoshikimate 1-carboxyvinyltransferase
MDLLVEQSDALTGVVNVPGDKSISHRAVIFGSLAEGVSVFSNFLMGEDCLATLEALSDMGVKSSINGKKITIHGVGLHGLKSPTKSLNLGNSGTSARLLLGLLGAQKFNSNIKGDKSLSNRPMNRVMDPLRTMGMEFSSCNGKLPINIFGNKSLNEINYDLTVPSAQVKSAIIIASIFANKSSKLTENHITRDHTERMMLAMNYPITSDRGSIYIEPGGRFDAIDFQIPGDFSSSVFLIVACLISKNSSITIKNVGINPTRIGFLEIAKRMGANIKILNK